MAKATRATDNTTPKKRTRKDATAAEPTKANGNGAVAAATVATTSPETVKETHTMPVLEEKIRARAYELYLQRHGRGGTPEQDWLQAVNEICGHQRAVGPS
jgi:hypothetical protein